MNSAFASKLTGDRVLLLPLSIEPLQECTIAILGFVEIPHEIRIFAGRALSWEICQR